MPVALNERIYRSEVLGGFWLRPDWIFEAEPRPMAALREVMGRAL